MRRVDLCTCGLRADRDARECDMCASVLICPCLCAKTDYKNLRNSAGPHGGPPAFTRLLRQVDGVFFMQSHVRFFAATSPVATAPPAGCASGGGDEARADRVSQGAPVVDDPLLALARAFVGGFRWDMSAPGVFVDFEHVELHADGTYSARVEATLVNPGVRSFRFPCTLPEQGRWNVYEVLGKTKLRVAPSTGRARVYSVSLDADTLSIARRGDSAILFREAASLDVDGRRGSSGGHDLAMDRAENKGLPL